MATDVHRRTRVHVDATGELAEVDDTEIFFDTARATPGPWCRSATPPSSPPDR